VPAPGIRTFDDVLDAEVRRGRVPGISAAVVQGDHVVWTGAAGTADLGHRTPMSSDAVCNWFSMTKIATATAAVQLGDDGALDLQAPVSQYLPYFAPVSPGGEVRVVHLLNHSSGLANPIPVRWVHVSGTSGPAPRDFFVRLLAKHRKLQFPPGERAAYTNIGYLALGEVIAAVTGGEYTDQVRRRVLEPLGMAATDFDYTASTTPRAAVGYQRLPRGLRPLLRVMLPAGIVGRRAGRFVGFEPFVLDGAAYGGLVGSSPDAARFAAAHLGQGAFEGARVLAADSAARMQRIETSGRPYDVGLGWFRPHGATDTPSFVEHLGGGAGFFNVMRLYPERAVGVVVMGNATKYNVDGVAAGLARLAWS
jgi:CubicO group peptidase (beta-lactamase class C family)